MSIKVNSGIKSKANELSTNENYSGQVEATLVYMNDGVRICSEACACCWDKKNPDEYEAKLDYIGRRCKTGHTSILEHSNLIILLKFPNIVNSTKFILDGLDTLCASHYLNAVFRQDSNNIPYIIIGGSYRGFIELFDLSYSPFVNNIIRSISKILYSNFDARLFYTLTSTGFLVEEGFIGVEPDPNSPFFNPLPEIPVYEDDKIKVLSVDNVDQISYNLRQIIGEDIFRETDLFRVASASILFKDMSRTATHQLVRHRNGITQESQRYVDYSNAAFADPTSFKPDKYDPDKKYNFEFGGQKFSMTSNEIGENIIGIYQYMLDQGMLKEDARSFLPGNVKCRKLYMTFTFKHLIKFLELRSHLAAQAEIRTYALVLKDVFVDILENKTGMQTKTSQVDEIISDKEVIMKNIIDNEPELKEDKKDD